MKSKERRRRRSPLAVELMERRELLSGAPVLFTSGALASRPTEWGIIPSSAHGELASYFHANIAVTKDVHGKPIDFNKDGLTDLVMGGGTSETVGYYPGDELVASTRNGLAEAYLADPNGGLKVIPGPSTIGDVKAWSWSHFAVLDVNGDGWQDVLKFSGGQISRYLWDPAGNTFHDRQDVCTINHAAYDGSSSLTMGDVNGDGLPDLALTDYDVNKQLLGFSIYLAQPPAPGGAWGGQFAPAPVATVTPRASIPILNNDLGSSGPGNVQPILADFNGDGHLDMAIPEQAGVTVFNNPGDGHFTQPNSTFVASVGSVLGFNLQAADFNNDGKTDLISTPNPVSPNMAGTIPPSIPTWNDVAAPVSVYLNTTTGGAVSFNVVSAGPTNNYLGFLQAGDFNLDGNMDIGVAFATRAGTTFAVGDGDGHGGFGAFKLYTAYTNTADGVYEGWERQVVAFGVGDFNGDRQLDVAATATMLNIDLGNAVSITGLSYNKTFAPPGALPANPPPAFAGQPYSLQLTPSGGDGARPYVYTLDPQSVPLPTGLTMSASGLIRGTPTQSGPFQLLVDVAQPNGLKGRSFVYLTVERTTPGVISPGVVTNAVAGVPFRLQFTDSAGPATWAVTLGALPPGLTLAPNGVLSGTPTGTGQYGFQLTATGNGFQSSLYYTMVSQAAGAPIVTGLVRYGYHNLSTTFVVAFSQDMNAQSASRLANYVLTTAGRDGRFGTRDDVWIPLKSAVYSAQTRTVTLTPTARTLSLFQSYRLVINGTPAQGLSGASGAFLGGQGIASPGTNYIRVFGPEVLVKPPVPVVRAAATRR